MYCDFMLRMKSPRFLSNLVKIPSLIIKLQAVKQSGLTFWPTLSTV